MPTYNIWGKVTFDVDFEIEAKNETEARKIAKERINDMYHLDSVGALHSPKSVTHGWYTDDVNE